jgi:hypothetical protein
LIGKWYKWLDSVYYLFYLILLTMRKQVLSFVILTLMSVSLYAQYPVTGSVWYHKNPEYPIPGVTVQLWNESGVIIAETITDTEGVYAFSDIPSGTFDVIITSDLPGVAITMQEAMTLYQYLEGAIELNPMELMAADVDGNGEVDMDDFLFVVNNYFIYGEEFPAGIWVFEETQVTTGVTHGHDGVGGVLIGELDDDFLPTGRDLLDHFDTYPAHRIEAGRQEVITIPVYARTAETQMTGYGLVLDYDPAVVEVLGVDIAGDGAGFAVFDNHIRISWVSDGPTTLIDELAWVQLKMRQPVNEYIPLQIGSESHLLDTKGQRIPRIEFAIPAVNTANPAMTDRIYPNPVIHEAYVRFEAESDMQLNIQITDATGRLVRTIQTEVRKGLQELPVTVNELLPGYYMLSLQNRHTNEYIFSRTLIKQ